MCYALNHDKSLTQNHPSRIAGAETTADGSATLIHRATGITYRSVYGAASESAHVFVEGTRVFDREGPWHILEFGLGGATNFMTTLHRYRQSNRKQALRYHAIERALIEPSLASQLHEQDAAAEDLRFLIDALAQGRANNSPRLVLQHPSLNVELTIWLGDFRSAQLPEAYFDAVYHDPFGPQVNPDGWTETWFTLAHRAMKAHAILTTYSAASAVRRAMAQSGLYLGTQPGSGGKREMTGASPSLEHLRGYKPLPASKQPTSSG